ncbi:DUF1269 domain-containing protein [Pseudonocardia charpentierae]|uniref:DUF1269 domain-containing protein n=1 Tax=Pseudonocardia charpentierae TaxID=3075545 RepID=A0ABU2NHJ4_9PSEU|nr:DUF1269 domain-containing protein [Pseudonocardia sp. DSM 45834]MDT0353421.1 DUF1269 domain-containing protein [Pseudonocardia sp. DSM 45834]
MVTFSIYTFDSVDGAQRVLAVVEALQDSAAVAFDDVAVVVWPRDAQRPVAWQEPAPVGRSGLSGAFWGLLFAVLFLLPLTGVEVDPQQPRGLLARVGLDDRLLQAIARGLTPGGSALFLLGDPEPPVARLQSVLTRRQARRFVAGLDEHQSAILHMAFGADPEPPRGDG